MSLRCISIYTRCTRCGENGGKKNLSGSGVGSFVRFVSWISHSVFVCVAAAASLATGQKKQRRKRSKVAGGGSDWRIGSFQLPAAGRASTLYGSKCWYFFFFLDRTWLFSFSARVFDYDLLGMYTNKSSRSLTLLTPSLRGTRGRRYIRTRSFLRVTWTRSEWNLALGTRTTTVRGTWTFISFLSRPFVAWTSVSNRQEMIVVPWSFDLQCFRVLDST